jgi:GNAT superfamily N-acetyltransferase
MGEMTVVPDRGPDPAATPGAISVRVADPNEVNEVSLVLGEAARWLEERGMPLWEPDELDPDWVAPAVRSGDFALGFMEGKVAGTLKFQLTDPEFWPEVVANDSAFVHRLAVRREFAGRGVSTALLAWARDRARAMGLDFLRLDCDATRPRLRSFYERHGFRYHSDFRWRRFIVARYELRLDREAL